MGQLLDIFVFTQLKKLTGGKHLWLRATGSTLISQAIDSFMVAYLQLNGVVLADGSTATFGFILQIVATGYTIKCFIAIGLTPLIYAGHEILHYFFKLKPLTIVEDQ